MIAQGGGSEQSFKVSRAPAPSYYRVPTPLADVEVARKARRWCVRADKAARAFDTRVKQVNGDATRTTPSGSAVANTAGRFAEDTQDLCRLGVQVVAEGKKGERRTGFYGGGGRVSFSHFDTFTPEQVAREAARQAVATLGAVGGAGGAADGGAGAGLERHPPARGGGPRPGGGLHPQGDLAVRGQAGPEGGLATW